MMTESIYRWAETIKEDINYFCKDGKVIDM